MSQAGKYDAFVWKSIKKQSLDFSRLCVGIDLSSQSVARQVFSALVSLTSVFGMGTGGPSPLKTPTIQGHTLKTEQRSGSYKDQPAYCRSSPRAISTGQLHTLLHFHLRPINQVVFLGPYS